MFSCFNLDLKKVIRNISPQTICYYYRLGLEESRNKKKSIDKKLDSYIKNGEIDGDTLQRDWFPQVDADIFISHSHKDMVRAHILAGWLKTTFENSINVFIDSLLEVMIRIQGLTIFFIDTLRYTGVDIFTFSKHLIFIN